MPRTVRPNATALGQLLRARRDASSPPRSGLRREEVAQLASISPTYLAILEQGRDVRPSRSVLDPLANALHLTPTERTHIHELVHGDPRVHELAPEVLACGLRELVDRLDPEPAYVTGRRWDVLASNRTASALWTDWDALPTAERNMI